MDEIRSDRGDEVLLVLVGNKADLVTERAVSQEEGQQKANEYGIMFMETSAKTGYQVKELFIEVANTLFERSNEANKGNESNNPNNPDNPSETQNNKGKDDNIVNIANFPSEKSMQGQKSEEGACSC